MIYKNYYFGEIDTLPSLDPYGYQKLICIIKKISHYIVFVDLLTCSVYIEEVIDNKKEIDREKNTRAISSDEEFAEVYKIFNDSGLYQRVLRNLNVK